MEKEIFELLTKMNDKLSNMENRMAFLSEDVNEIKEAVNRIEASQTADVVGLLKLQTKKTDFEVDYINKRLTEMDKQIFEIQQRLEN